MALTAHVDGLVHEPTQTEGPGLDLTVGAVHRVAEPGRVDFGGAELEPAGHEPVPTEARDPDDDYGWWTLVDGVYRLGYNETVDIPDDATLVVQTRDALAERGAFHPTRFLAAGATLEGAPLAVDEGGLHLKENARVSTLLEL